MTYEKISIILAFYALFWIMKEWLDRRRYLDNRQLIIAQHEYFIQKRQEISVREMTYMKERDIRVMICNQKIEDKMLEILTTQELMNKYLAQVGVSHDI